MRPFLIGITGGSGSGKTSFIRQLKATFSENELCVISQDDYYLPREQQQKDSQGIVNFDLPQSIDEEAFAADLGRLIAGETVRRKEYTFNNERIQARELVFRSAPIIIVEGLFVFHFNGVWEKLDLKVFLHAKENLKVIRRIKRDQVERNYPLEDVLYRYEHHVLPTFERYIEPYKEKADIIINNNHAFEGGLQVVIGFIRNYLQKHQA